MSNKLWDVIIVGGGPAGVTAALRLAREDLDVILVEAAVYPGAENWSGAVYFAENLADPAVLGPEELERAPYERRVVKRGFFATNGLTLAGAEYRDPDVFSHCYTVLRPVYDRYLAERARQLGVTLLTETTVDGLIREGRRVIGVHTDRGPIYGGLVFLAEGDASHLVSKEGFEREAVRASASRQPAFLQGVKEVIELDPALIDQRFGVGAGEAACYEVLLRNGAVDGKPVRLNMAGFIYTNRGSVSIGLVLPLQNLAALGGDYNRLMEWYKRLPPIRRLIEGGESLSYGAKIIRGGGLREIPRLVDDGVAIGGAATGIGVDFPYPNFTGPACAMGKIFAETALELQRRGEPPTEDRLDELYTRRVLNTCYYKDVEHLRDWPAFIEHTEALFGRQIDLLNGSLYAMTRPDLRFGQKWWETIRLVGETLKGRWRRTLGDLSRGSRALGIGRFALRHAPIAVLLSIPNTLIALIPFAWGRSDDRLRFSFWVDGEETGRLPWFKRWLGARYTPALSRAAGVLYANDGVPLEKKLERCVGLVARRLSLWEVIGALVGILGFGLTRAAQKLGDAIRLGDRRPTRDEIEATFYGRWLSGWRALTDLSSEAVATDKSHDAKLGEITYAGEEASHIKVFFPPNSPGELEDPGASALWGVCPAAVYQVNQDRTLHASVTVNFENCVKCETCWRVEPQHVDWTRFGRHRLIFEVYTDADEPLRRLLEERSIEDGPAVAADYWEVSLAGDWPDPTRPAASELVDSIQEARRAIRRAEAVCDGLHRDVWEGPSVLEPGQVDWCRGAVEYFAALAEEAALATLAEPIADWLLSREMERAHLRVMQLREDLHAVTERLRSHAASRRFFAAEADARQVRDHHLAGMRAVIERVAEGSGVTAGFVDPVAELRALEEDPPDRAAARAELRERLSDVFDRQAIRRLEHGGDLEREEVELLRAAARAALGSVDDAAGFSDWSHLQREDIIGELARVDPSLAALLAGHLAAVAALTAAGAPDDLLEPLLDVERFAGAALEERANREGEGWSGRLPFALTALADAYVIRGEGCIAVLDPDAEGLAIESTPAIGLTGARVAELALDGVGAVWEGDWDEVRERALFGVRARDIAALALGASGLLAERAVDHARNRIQFPDMFQDIDGRDGVGKFGAVRAHLAHIEAGRLAIETLLPNAAWTAEDGNLEASIAKVAVTEVFGPAIPSITYRAGQVIGGTAFSEDDVFAKLYRDSSIFPHYLAGNARLCRQIGASLDTTGGIPLLAGVAGDAETALTAMGRRPMLDFEVERLRTGADRLADSVARVLAHNDEPAAVDVIHEIAGGLATRLYVWLCLLIRVHRRLEAALPAERLFEAARLWADGMEERLLELEDELRWSGRRVELGGLAFQLEGYPDRPTATGGFGLDYGRDIVGAERAYRSGDFLLGPIDLEAPRYIPEAVWSDVNIREHYEEYLRDFRERFRQTEGEPPYGRRVERLHYIPREDIVWTRDQGYFRVVIPTRYGGQGRTKAAYYALCMISKRLADVSHTLTIQANTSIGTTPILFGLFHDVATAERDLEAALAGADEVADFQASLAVLLARRRSPDIESLESDFRELNKKVNARLGRSRILKNVVFGRFLSQLRKAATAGMSRDLPGFFAGLEKALEALTGWQERARAELEEIPRRRHAHEFFLRLISARMISAFALTEPSAGSDTARQRTEARLDRRRVHTDDDGVKFFYLDEAEQEGRRNIADMRRFEFDGPRILYRYRDDAEPAEVLSQEYSYEDDAERYRYFMVGDRRVDVHDMALVREADGEEYYEFYVLNGAKMWITNGHIAGVEALYARTPAGVTGFMVDALTEGFLVGKDEEKMGQRGSPTNEITLTNVRVPRECMIGIEGRGQENALETLNVGRTGLCISAAAGMQQRLEEARAHLGRSSRGAEAWARYRLGLAMEEMFATEALAYNLIGLYDDDTSDSLRIESSIGKLFGTDGTHRVTEYLEPVYGIEGQTQRFMIEKDRRDDRVMTIYEGTNEIQQFLLLKDLIDLVGPKLERIDTLEAAAGDSPYAEEVQALSEMLAELRERVTRTRNAYRSAAWQRALLQPVFFRLSRMAMWVKAVDSVVHRAHWVRRRLSADGDAARRQWCDGAARSFVARARREFRRLVRGFDRDLETLRAGGRTAELRLAEAVLDEPEARPEAVPTDRLEREPFAGSLEIVVAMERSPLLAPRPRLLRGRLAEHVARFTAGDRRALRLALALKAARPEAVRVTAVCAGPRSLADPLRHALAAGADRAILLDTGGDGFAEHALAEALAAALDARRLKFDLLLAGASGDSPSGGRLGLRLAERFDLDWLPDVRDLWVRAGQAAWVSRRFPDAEVRSRMPAVAGVHGDEDEPDWAFSTEGFARALRKPLDVVAVPTDAERLDEEYATAGAAVAAGPGEDVDRIDPERAAEVLIDVGELGDGAGGPTGQPYTGEIRRAGAGEILLGGVMFVAELEDDDDLTGGARATLEVAAGLAARTVSPLNGVVLGEPLDDTRRRAIAGRLIAAAGFDRLVFAESPALGAGTARAYAEALKRLVGPEASYRPQYLLTTAWLSEALPMLAETLREAHVPAEELAGVSRVEFRDGEGVAFVRPTHERRLRARVRRPIHPDRMRIVWCEPQVGGDGGARAEKETEVLHVPLELDYDPQADAIARALAAARKELGVVTLENAEYIIDVGAGLGSVDNLETVVEPLRRALLDLGAPHVQIGATRKVTMDMSWLPDEHQIGQTGLRVNPRVMIALGVSGAPQHVDYIGERAVIFAFNLDPQAPLMTLNQRREQPKVYPVVGNLFETVPKFIAALKARAGGGGR